MLIKHEDAGVELLCLCIMGVFLLFVLFCSVGLFLFLSRGGRRCIVCVLSNVNKILFKKREVGR